MRIFERGEQQCLFVDLRGKCGLNDMKENMPRFLLVSAFFLVSAQNVCGDHVFLAIVPGGMDHPRLSLNINKRADFIQEKQNLRIGKMVHNMKTKRILSYTCTIVTLAHFFLFLCGAYPADNVRTMYK